MRDITHIVIHCTAGPQWQTADAILEYWKKVLGWKTPGYHHLISADGTDHQLVPIHNISNGVAGHNKNAIHLSYIGGVEMLKGHNSKGQPINITGKPLDNRTVDQLITLEILVRNYHEIYPKAEICGHRDFSPDKNRDGIISPNEWMKACPSFSVKNWLKEIEL